MDRISVCSFCLHRREVFRREVSKTLLTWQDARYCNINLKVNQKKENARCVIYSNARDPNTEKKTHHFCQKEFLFQSWRQLKLNQKWNGYAVDYIVSILYRTVSEKPSNNCHSYSQSSKRHSLQPITVSRKCLAKLLATKYSLNKQKLEEFLKCVPNSRHIPDKNSFDRNR